MFNRLQQPQKNNSNQLLLHKAPQGLYPVVYQNLILPNLPAPLHFLHFMCLMGRPRLAISSPQALGQAAVHNQAHILLSSSPHLFQHQQHYALNEACNLTTNQWQFAQTDSIQRQGSEWEFSHKQQGFSLELQVLSQVSSAWSAQQWGLAQAWSLAVQAKGQLHYQQQQYDIQTTGCIHYARSVALPLWPIYFYCLQVIQVDELQLTLLQIRNQWNQVLSAQLIIRNAQGFLAVKKAVTFHIQRVYPKVMTPQGQCMYLPREFSWHCQENGKTLLELHGFSRGDFKYGMGAGYVGSFRFELYFAGQDYIGESAYCEYIDCRPLRFQEKNDTESLKQPQFMPQTCAFKQQK